MLRARSLGNPYDPGELLTTGAASVLAAVAARRPAAPRPEGLRRENILSLIHISEPTRPY